MSALGSLVVKLALEYAQYTQGLSKADQEALKFAQNAQRQFDKAASSSKEFFVGVVQGATAAAAAYVSVGAVIDGLKSSIDTLAKLDDMAQKTGSAVENLSRLQKVAVATGSDFGLVDGSLSKLAKGMATVDGEANKTNKALDALGISSKDVSGKLRDPSQVMVDIARKLQDYEDGAGKAALATDLFGKSGAELLPYLNDVAEKIDKFTGVSADAAARATEFQDQLGMLKVGANDLFTVVAVDLLPTMNDFIGALSDSKTASDKLTGNTQLTSWVDDLAVGLARVVDVAKIIPSAIRAIGGSFEAVGADLEYLNYVKDNANPVSVAKKLVTGGSPHEDLKNALAKRNKIVEEANKRYDELWNKPANTMEQAILGRIAGRNTAGEDALDSLAGILGKSKEKTELNYQSGNERKEKAVKDVISDYEKLTRSINEKIAAESAEAVSSQNLTAAEKIRIKLLVDLAGGTVKMTGHEVSLTKARLDVLDTLEKSRAAMVAVEKIYASYNEEVKRSIADATREAEQNERLAETFGMTKGQIEAMELARLQDRLAQRSSLGLTMQEIEALEKLIEVKQRSANALLKFEGYEAAKKAADDASRAWEKSADDIADWLGDGLARGFGKGKSLLKSLLDSIKSSFARLILNPVIQPIAGMGASYLNPNAPQAGGMNGVFQGSSLINAGKTIWQGFSGGMSSTIGGGISGLGNLLGSSTLSGFGTGMQGASLAPGLMGPTTLGAPGAMGLGSSVATAMPYVAAAVAAAVIAQKAFGIGKKEVTATGIQGSFNGEGFTGAAFEDWKRKGGWVRSGSSGTGWSDIDPVLEKSMAAGFASVKSATKEFAQTLGIEAGGMIDNFSESIRVEFNSNEEENKAMIARVFSDLGGHMAEALVPDLQRLRLEGEESAVTLQRLATEYRAVDVVLATLGKTSEQAFGAVGIASIDARERLIALAGGIDALIASTSFYSANFLTEAEQVAPVMKSVNAVLDEVGWSGITTREEFKALVSSLDLSSEAGAKWYAELMRIAPAFVQVSDYTKKLADDAIALAKEPQAVSDAREVLSRAYEREYDALKGTIDRFKDFSKSIKDFNASLLTGELSSLSLRDKTTIARRRFDETYARTQSSDKDVAAQAMAELQGVSETFLQALQASSSTGLEYADGLAKVRNALQSTASTADKEVNIAQQQLDMLNMSVSGILQVRDAVISLPDALAAYFNEGGTKTNAAGVATTPTISDALGAQVAAYGATNGVDSYYVIPGVNDFTEKSRAVNDLVRLGAYSDAESAFQSTYGMSQAAWQDIEKNFSAGIPVQARAGGGYTPPGLTWVGEEGPELVNFERPGQVYTADQSRQMMSRWANPSENNAALVREVRLLRDEVSKLRQAADRTQDNTKRATDVLEAVVRGSAYLSVEAI